jgi:transcriptional regulator with XRE-family HTH domain
MTFSEKLTMILQALGIRNAELARASGLDPSAVSRLRTGRRGAAPGGPQMRKLIDGLCLLAGERGNIPKLLALCNGDNAPRLPEALSSWLGGGMVPDSAKKARTTKKSRIEFGRRLPLLWTFWIYPIYRWPKS